MAKNYRRIVSLVPSLTELLFEFGLGGNIAGRTRFCIRPEKEVSRIPVIGGTKNPDIGKIRKLNPDFILANREENRKQDVEAMKRFSRVHVTHIRTVEEACASIGELGMLLACSEQAGRILAEAHRHLAETPEVEPKSAAYIIWKDPWMAAGGDTYIHDVMKHWKLHNFFASQSRYPVVDTAALSADPPDLLLLASEPFPFREKHLPEAAAVFTVSKILLIDGQWFSWYGSRMPQSFESLNRWREALNF